jgi:hypothetical protein
LLIFHLRRRTKMAHGAQLGHKTHDSADRALNPDLAFGKSRFMDRPVTP